MSTIRKIIDLPTKNGTIQIITFDGLEDNKEHIAIGVGNWKRKRIPEVRIHSECFTGDVLGSFKCDCGDQLQSTLLRMNSRGGLILYMRQEGRGIGLYNKIDAYKLQQEGLDTVEANKALGFKDDLRKYDVSAQMLKILGIRKIKLHTNNPQKEKGLKENGIIVTRIIPTLLFLKNENRNYLKTKALKSGHIYNIGVKNVLSQITY